MLKLAYRPADQRAVLSWDETHLLIQARTSEQPFVVVPRSVYA